MNRWWPVAVLLLLVAAPADASVDDVEQSAVARAAASVVQIQTSGSVGTGFVVEGGWVVTAAHVVDGVAVLVTPEGRRLRTTVIGSDAEIDLAVLMVDGLPNHPPLALADDLPELASDVYALTAPAGQVGVTVSRGIVSGIVRANGQQVIQTDAAVNPGSSGGPVISVDGQLVGVTSSKLDGSEGVAFLVPADEVSALTRGVITDAPPTSGELPPAESAPTSSPATAWDPLALGVAALIGAALTTTTVTTRRRRRSRTTSPFHLDINLGPERLTATPDRDRK